MLRSSTELSSRLKKPVNAIKHVPVLDQLATVGLLDAFLNACDEAGLIFKHAANSIFDKLLCVLAIGHRYLLQACFNVGRETNFHAARLRNKRLWGNGGTVKAKPVKAPRPLKAPRRNGALWAKAT